MEEPLYIAIGRLSVAFSKLEDQLKDLISALLSQDRRIGEIVTSKMAFSALCDLTKALFRHKVSDKELIDFFEELMPQIERCAEGRNTYIHSSWNTQEPLIPYIRSKLKKGKTGELRDNWQAMGAGDILDLTECIEETEKGLFELLLHMSIKGVTNYLSDMLGEFMPTQGMRRHFKARQKPPKPWGSH